MAREALKRRGSLTIWFDPAMTWEAAPTGKRGRQPDYSDAAIETCLTMKGEGRLGNDPVGRFSPERAKPRDGSAWRSGRSSHGNATGSSEPARGIKVEGEGEWTEEGQKTVRGTVCPAIGCTVSNCWADASWRATLTVRSPSSRSVSFAGSLGPVAFARSFLNGFTALGVPVTETVG